MQRERKITGPRLRIRRGLVLFAYLVVVLCLVALTGCGRDKVLTLEDLSQEASDPLEMEAERDSRGENAGTSDVETAEETAMETVPMEEPEISPDICIYICGEVMHPGVYELPAGSRVRDAVEAAGGLTEVAAPEYLNLAAYLADAQKIYMPGRDPVSGEISEESAKALSEDAPVQEPKGSAGSTDEKRTAAVDLNHADIAELCTLPGIGESKAQAIIRFREEQGGFQAPEELLYVSGIGQASYEKLKDLVTVE